MKWLTTDLVILVAFVGTFAVVIGRVLREWCYG